MKLKNILLVFTSFFMVVLLNIDLRATPLAKSSGTDNKDTYRPGILIHFVDARDEKTLKRLYQVLRLKKYERDYSAKFIEVERWAQLKRNNIPDNALMAREKICRELMVEFKSVLLKSCELDTELNPLVGELNSTKHLDAASNAIGVDRGTVEKCPLLEPLDGVREVKKGLSTFWAQEYVGLDLAFARWQEWAEIQKTLKSSTPEAARVLALDTSSHFDHGRSVRDLIAMNTPDGAAKSPGAKKRITYFDANGSSDLGSTYIEALDNYSEGLDVVNVSMNGLSKAVLGAFEKYSSQHNAIFAVGAGNEYPKYDRSKNNFHAAIYVGSLQPNGLLSRSTAEFGAVSITAPSNKELVANDPRKPFGGTSGATALVSSALAMLKSVLPQIDAQTAKELLQKTALPTFNAFEHEPRLNGAGTLNAYRLIDEAIAIRDKCAEKLSLDCIKIQAAIVRNGHHELDKALQGRVSRIFSCPLSSKLSMPQEYSCAEKKKLFNDLRKAALSQTRAAPYWDLLGCVHQRMQFDQNAEFYRKLSLGGWPPFNNANMRKVILGESRQLEPDDRHRLDFLTTKNIEKFDSHPKVKMEVEQMLADHKLVEITKIEKSMAQPMAKALENYLLDDNSDVRQMAIKKVLRKPGLINVNFVMKLLRLANPETRLDLLDLQAKFDVRSSGVGLNTLSVLKAAMNDESYLIRMKVMSILSQAKLPTEFPAELETKRLIEKGLSDSDENVQRIAVSALGQLSEKQSLPHFERLIKSDNADLRSVIFESLQGMSPSSSLNFIDQGLKDLDLSVRSAAVRSLHRFSEVDRLIRLRVAVLDDDYEVREAAIETAFSLSPKNALLIVDLAFQNSSKPTRQQAIALLNSLSGDQRKDFLQAGQSHPSEYYRQSVEWASSLPKERTALTQKNVEADLPLSPWLSLRLSAP